MEPTTIWQRDICADHLIQRTLNSKINTIVSADKKYFFPIQFCSFGRNFSITIVSKRFSFPNKKSLQPFMAIIQLLCRTIVITTSSKIEFRARLNFFRYLGGFLWYSGYLKTKISIHQVKYLLTFVGRTIITSFNLTYFRK